MRDSQSNSGSQAFGHCLMDGDPEVVRLARRNRRRSMFLSTLIQAGLLTAAIVLPLFASHSMKLYIQTPNIPVPRGLPGPEVREAGRASSASGPRVPRPDSIFTVIRVPQGVRQVDDINTSPVVHTGPGPSCPSCSPDGVDGLARLFSESTRIAQPPTPPEPMPKPRGPIEVSRGVQEARLIRRVEPRYPPLMLQIHKEGRVEFRAIIATDGTIGELTLISGHPGFVPAAQDAVLQWRYTPTLLNGEPVEVQTYITVIFILNR